MKKIEHNFHVGEARSHPSGYVLTGFTITSRKKINSYIKKIMIQKYNKKNFIN